MKTKDAFALRGLYKKFTLWQAEVQKANQTPFEPNEKEKYVVQLYWLEEGWLDIIENYLKKYPVPPYERSPSNSVVLEIAKFVLDVSPRINAELSKQALKNIERHIGRLRVYSQKFFADALSKGIDETLRIKGNRVNELIAKYEYIATFFKAFRETALKQRDRENEKFQKEIRIEFGRKLKESRKAAKLTQQQLADVVGLKTFNAIAQYERGISEPSLPTLYRISKVLNRSADWLLSLQ